MWFLSYFLLHLLVYSLLRLQFFIWNRSSFTDLSGADTAMAFFQGLRFDLSAVAATAGLCLLLLPWLLQNAFLRKFWLWFFVAINSILIIINAADTELFNFTAKRFTSSSFFLVHDAHVSNLVLPYLPLAFTSFLILAGYVITAGWMISRLKLQLILRNKFFVSFAVLICAVVFSRGGFQLKPITFVDAKIYNNTYANNLVLNSSFTLLKSASKSSLQKIGGFSENELLEQLNPQNIEPLVTEFEKPNVLVLILESFSQEYTELKNPEATPFLNELRKKSADFKNSYANGRRSIEGIAAILSGIPALMEEPFINSEFSANQIIGLGSILNSNGYHTSFFHGADQGTMHFDSFVKSVGIQNHFSQQSYPQQSDYDGTWGIFDEPFLNWACEKYGTFKTPFFSTVFTLSSHQPYKLPRGFDGEFKDGRLEILKSIQYADFSLKNFFECAQKQSWYNNTIFILTADHTGPGLSSNADFLSRYKVPIVIFSPKKAGLEKLDTDQFAQHIDLFPTILDLLKIEIKNRNYLARSLLRPGPKLIALYSDGQYQLTGNVKNPELQLKAVQQYFSEGMYDNRLYYPTK